MGILQASHVSSDKKSIIIRPKQSILCPEPLCPGILVAQISPETALFHILIGYIRIRPAVYISLVIHIAVIRHVVQTDIGEIFAQSNVLHILQPLCLKTLLHVIIKNTFRSRLIGLLIHILQRQPHPFCQELVFIDNGIRQPVPHTQNNTETGQQKRQPQKGCRVFQISLLYSGSLLTLFHLISLIPRIPFYIRLAACPYTA